MASIWRHIMFGIQGLAESLSLRGRKPHYIVVRLKDPPPEGAEFELRPRETRRIAIDRITDGADASVHWRDLVISESWIALATTFAPRAGRAPPDFPEVVGRVWDDDGNDEKLDIHATSGTYAEWAVELRATGELSLDGVLHVRIVEFITRLPSVAEIVHKRSLRGPWTLDVEIERQSSNAISSP